MSETLSDTTTQQPDVSTELDQTQATGAGTEGDTVNQKTDEEPAPEKPLSARDAIEKATKDVLAKEEKQDKSADKAADKNPAAEKNEDRANEENRSEGSEKNEREVADEARQEADGKSDRAERPAADRRYSTPPETMLPKAKEVWANTPNAVKAEVYRIQQEAAQEREQVSKIKESWDKIAKYDEMAKESGTTIDVALGRYVDMEQRLRENPVQGIAEILKNVGLTPQQYAKIVTENSPQYQALMMQRMQTQQQAPQKSPDVVRLEQQLHEERTKSVQAQIIEPFAKSHARFDELQGNIVSLLNSDIIPKSLGPVDRLEAAYDMAVRLNPSSSSDAAPPAAPSKTPPANPLAGKKSISGSPSAGASASSRKGKLSRREALAAAMDSAR
ncbi:MAG: hypothetical protein ABF968_04845 [Acetobacter sp.]|uniref:hypothetical protein n=1 Tax=Acetobacter sp. TaxID=440 RepID=UPI0039E84B58